MQIKTTHYFERVARNEARDCTVRALAAVKDMRYDQAHAALAAAGREVRRGMSLEQLKPAYLAAGGGEYVKRSDRPTLAAFMREHSAGRYIVLVVGHVFAVVDGVQIDMEKNGARKRVWGFWQFNGE